MVAPDAPYALVCLGILLLVLIAVLVVRAMRKDRLEFARFKRFRTTARRKQMYRKWLIDSIVTFGGSAIIVGLVVFQFVPLLQAEIDAVPWVAAARAGFADAGAAAIVVVITLIVVIVVGTVIAIVLARDTESVAAIGDIQALLPRNRAELGWGAALSVNAGIVEELLFRLALPALIYGVSRNALVAVVASLLLFGVLHLYQGPVGVIASTLIGAFLMALYFASGTILVPIILHALIDLRSLVLIPVVVGRVHRVDGGVSVLPKVAVRTARGAHAAHGEHGGHAGPIAPVAPIAPIAPGDDPRRSAESDVVAP